MPQTYDHKENSCHEHTSVQTGHCSLLWVWVCVCACSGLVATQHSVAAALTRNLAHWLCTASAEHRRHC